MVFTTYIRNTSEMEYASSQNAHTFSHLFTTSSMCSFILHLESSCDMILKCHAESGECDLIRWSSQCPGSNPNSDRHLNSNRRCLKTDLVEVLESVAFQPMVVGDEATFERLIEPLALEDLEDDSAAGGPGGGTDVVSVDDYHSLSFWGTDRAGTYHDVTKHPTVHSI